MFEKHFCDLAYSLESSKRTVEIKSISVELLGKEHNCLSLACEVYDLAELE
jgi:hypothetical protein